MCLWDWIPEDGQVVFVILFGAFCYLLFFLAKYFAGLVSNDRLKSAAIADSDPTLFFIPSCHNKTLTKKEKKKMSDYSDYIQDVVKTKKVWLFIFKKCYAVLSMRCSRTDLSEPVFIPQVKLYDWYLQQCAAEYDL